MERIFVTGGAGFIGSHTVDLLLQQGKQVVVLDNLSSGNILNLNLQHPNLEFIEGDILEYPLVQELMDGCDAAMHFAAIASVPQSIDNPIYTFQVNVQGFLHVLEAVRSHYPMRFVYVSSAAVYGDAKELPCRDDVPLTAAPLSPYALQKYNNEQYAALYDHLHGIKSLGLRYFNVYGSRQDPRSPYSGVISRFLDAYHSGAELTVFGDGLQSRDFIHVSDIAKANVLALQSDYAGVMNVATGSPQTLLDLIAYIGDAGGHPAAINFAPERTGDIKISYATVGKASEHLGFRASVPLVEGVRRLVAVA